MKLFKFPARASQPPPIGADFAAHGLNLVQAAPRDGGFSLMAAASLPYPVPRAELLAAPGELARFVGTALAASPFKGRRVLSALPPADVRILPLTLPPAPNQSEAQAVAKAAAEQLGVDGARSVLDYYPIRGADGDTSGRLVDYGMLLRLQDPNQSVSFYSMESLSNGNRPVLRVTFAKQC